jgi:hypothetical protein
MRPPESQRFLQVFLFGESPEIVRDVNVAMEEIGDNFLFFRQR